MGPHEKSALQGEYVRLRGQAFKTQGDGRRLDEIEKLLQGDLPYPYRKGDVPCGLKRVV